MKAGYKTTEFWITIAIMLWGVLGVSLPPLYQAGIPLVAGGIYTLARGLAKAGMLRGTVGEELKNKE